MTPLLFVLTVAAISLGAGFLGSLLGLGGGMIVVPALTLFLHVDIRLAIGASIISVIATSNDTVTTTILVGIDPLGVAVAPDGGKVYVANAASNDVSVIAASSDTVTATIPVGTIPYAFGMFIQPAEPPVPFSGTPGTRNCHGQSAAALATQFGDLHGAAEALGFSNVRALQNAIWAFCR